MIIMVWSFFKDAKKYMEELKAGKVALAGETEEQEIPLSDETAETVKAAETVEVVEKPETVGTVEAAAKA